MSSDKVSIKNVLISVSDKSGLDTLACHLHQKGARIFSTSGTADFLKGWAVPVESVEFLTKQPELLGGRVKTLHPAIFAGLLAKRDSEEDLSAIASLGGVLFDLVIVNLYPFSDHLHRPIGEQIEYVDIGGPSLIRAAAKNHHWVTVLSSPSDYFDFISLTSAEIETDLSFRKTMAQRSFSRVSEYDHQISKAWMESSSIESRFPRAIEFNSTQTLRYGENPHQQAMWSGDQKWEQLQGKELSFNNILDSEAASRLVSDFPYSVCCIVKHNNPCGVAWAPEGTLSKTLFSKALSCDPKSAFGGVVATNYSIGGFEASALIEVFLECVIAPDFSPEALSILKDKPNLRLIKYPNPVFSPFELREALGGWLIQDTDRLGREVTFQSLSSKDQPSPDFFSNMLGLWLVCKHTRSNAIVIGKGHQTWGIGSGQVSRIDALETALGKAQEHAKGAIITSDAFFPFRDSIDRLAGLEIAAVVQPGGSKRDSEVFQACTEHGIPLYLTGERHFRH